MNDDEKDKKDKPITPLDMPSDADILKLFKDAHQKVLKGSNKLLLIPDPEAIWAGFAIIGETEEERAASMSHYWQATCPCGIQAFIPLNGIPKEEIPWPCTNPNHWMVKHVSKPEKPEPETEPEKTPESEKEPGPGFDLSKIPEDVVN